MTAGRLQQVERPSGVHVEVVEGAAARQVVRGLGRAVDDQVGHGLTNRAQHRRAVADIEHVVLEPPACRLEPPQVPGRVALRTKEVGAHVVVDAVHPRAALVKVTYSLRADQPTAPGYDHFHVRFTLLSSSSVGVAGVGVLASAGLPDRDRLKPELQLSKP
jgi:hypothetical protein